MTKSPKIQVQLKDGQLLPITEYDAVMLDKAKNGQVYTLTPTGRRSNPHINKYWLILDKVVEATGEKWPSKEHLHDELKYACGYFRIRYSEISEMFMRYPDSISFDDMNQQEFNAYFEITMAKLSEALGYDPVNS